jgi:hypothetical protein
VTCDPAREETSANQWQAPAAELGVGTNDEANMRIVTPVVG